SRASFPIRFLVTYSAAAATYTPSLHAALPILAIDVGALELEDETTIEVLEGWEARAAGADPCGAYPESERSALLRSAVCAAVEADRKSTRLNSSHVKISYAVFCLKKKKENK